jgi:Threonine aldolase
MIHFDNDYTEGAHEKILERFIETNRVQTPGYGFDEYSERARTYIKKL